MPKLFIGIVIYQTLQLITLTALHSSVVFNVTRKSNENVSWIFSVLLSLKFDSVKTEKYILRQLYGLLIFVA